MLSLYRYIKNLSHRRAIDFTLFTLVGVGSLIVGAGWAFDIPTLRSISTEWVTMKIWTTLLFLLSSTFWFKKTRDLAATLVIFISCMLLGATLSGGDVSIYEDTGVPYTISPGSPSLVTLACFIVLALVTLLGHFHRLVLLVMGACSLCLIGYAIDQPLLYFYVPNVSTGMAVHTSVLLMILSVAIYLMEKPPAQIISEPPEP